MECDEQYNRLDNMDKRATSEKKPVKTKTTSEYIIKEITRGHATLQTNIQHPYILSKSLGNPCYKDPVTTTEYIYQPILGKNHIYGS